MGPSLPSTAIDTATEDCRRCLEQFVLAIRLTDNERAQDQMIDFNMWIVGIDALAGKSASLGARLSSQPVTRLILVDLYE
jgi:hypothetical protein